MSWNAQQIDHRGHANVAGTSAEKPAENSTDERDEKDRPERNRIDSRMRQTDLRCKLDPLKSLRKTIDGRDILFPVFGRLTALGLLAPIDPQCHPTLPGAENGDPGEHDNRHGPDH